MTYIQVTSFQVVFIVVHIFFTSWCAFLQKLDLWQWKLFLYHVNPLIDILLAVVNRVSSSYSVQSYINYKNFKTKTHDDIWIMNNRRRTYKVVIKKSMLLKVSLPHITLYSMCCCCATFSNSNHYHHNNLQSILKYFNNEN